MDREAWWATVHGVPRVGHGLVTKPPLEGSKGFLGDTSDKESACQCRRCKRHGFDSQVGKIPGRGHGNPLQYSCLETPMNRRTWQPTVHEESDTTEVT